MLGGKPYFVWWFVYEWDIMIPQSPCELHCVFIPSVKIEFSIKLVWLNYSPCRIKKKLFYLHLLTEGFLPTRQNKIQLLCTSRYIHTFPLHTLSTLLIVRFQKKWALFVRFQNTFEHSTICAIPEYICSFYYVWFQNAFEHCTSTICVTRKYKTSLLFEQFQNIIEHSTICEIRLYMHICI